MATTAVKNKRFAGASVTSDQIIDGATNPELRALIGGKSLMQVGMAFDLLDEDIKWGYSKDRDGNEHKTSVTLRIDGKKYNVPLSAAFRKELMDGDMADGNLVNCVFYATHLTQRNVDGTPKTNEAGAIVLDESRPWLSFGRVNGRTITKEEDFFAEAVGDGVPDANA